MKVFQIRTTKTFSEITQKISDLKKSQNENLFGFMEEFDFKNVEIDENKIFIERDGKMFNFKKGNGIILIKPLNENELEIIISPNKLLNTYFKFNLLIAILFLILINIYNSYNTKNFSLIFLIFTVVFFTILVFFYKLIEFVNLLLLKDYITRFIKNCH